MQIEKGVLVGSRCFDNYSMQTLTDSQWRVLVSLGAYMGEYGAITDIKHAAFILRVNSSFLADMINILIDLDVLEDFGANKFGLNPSVGNNVIEMLR